MQQLRILTGQHAGAQLRLVHRAYRIASDEEADIQITDWDHAPLVLVVEHKDSGVSMVLHHCGEDGQAAQLLGPLVDFMPRSFGDIVMCAGPDEASWPSDMALLARLMAPKPAPARAGGRSVGLTLSAVLSVVVLLGGIAGVVLMQPVASAPVAPPSPMERVQQALRHAGVSGLTIRPSSRHVLVEGLLPTSAETARVRAALQGFGDEVVLHRYAAASDMVRQINDALHRPGLQVAYVGAGVFKVDGDVADPARLREDVRRVAADIGPLVVRIDVAVKEALPSGGVHVGSMLQGDDLHYVQTADGTKHLSLQTSADDLSDAALPPSTPQGDPDGQLTRADGVR